MPITIVNNNNTTVTDLGGGVYEIEKTGGADAARDAGAVSSVGVAGDFVLRIENIAGGYNLAGVNTSPTADDSWEAIDFGWWYNSSGNQWYRLLSGTWTSVDGTAGPGGVYWIWRTSGTLYMGHGADLATAQSSPDYSVANTDTLYFDCSLDNVGDKIEILFYVPHDAGGVLTGQLGSVSGSARRFRAHAASGELVGSGAAIEGSASRAKVHYATGELVGAGSAMTATARRVKPPNWGSRPSGGSWSNPSWR